MVDKAKAAEAKAKGNQFFTAKNYAEAIVHFSEAIEHDPTDHVFYSNRSACYASLEKYTEALADATKCVEIKPDWPKGYTRKGLAEYFLGKHTEAKATYEAGLKLAPEDAALKEGLKKVQSAQQGGGGGMGNPFGNLDMMKVMNAINNNPKLKEYMKDPQFTERLQMLMQSGSNQQVMMMLIQQDQRLLEVVMASMGMDVMGPEEAAARAKAQEEANKPAPKKPEPKPEPVDERTDSQKAADEWKQKGNEHYKKKEFAEAHAMYDKAIETEPNDMIYVNNKAAVFLEEAKYDEAIDLCQKALDRRYEMNGALSGGASFEKVGKVYSRMAKVYEKQCKYDDALKMYEKALTEDNNRTIRNAQRECERAKEKWEKESYMDPAKAEEHKDKGNEFFKQNQFADAKKEYDEAIKRNPSDAKLYSNRAAALTKLFAYPDALRDLDECLKLDPKFVKAYSRKGAAHFFMKEYHKALEAYNKGLAIEENNAECLQGRAQVMAKIQQTSSSKEVDEEQVRHAMADPEIQNILKDPQINIVLQQLQENPKHAQDAINKDPKIASAIQKLMAAGILRVG